MTSSHSCGLNPCAATTSAVILGSVIPTPDHFALHSGHGSGGKDGFAENLGLLPYDGPFCEPVVLGPAKQIAQLIDVRAFWHVTGCGPAILVRGDRPADPIFGPATVGCGRVLRAIGKDVPDPSAAGQSFEEVGATIGAGVSKVQAMANIKGSGASGVSFTRLSLTSHAPFT